MLTARCARWLHARRGRPRRTLDSIARDARATTDRATIGDGRFRLDLPDGGVRGGAPLVVVCGWYGALDKHVVKYTDVMKSWGCATLRTIGIPSMGKSSLFNRPMRRDKPAAKRIAPT